MLSPTRYTASCRNSGGRGQEARGPCERALLWVLKPVGMQAWTTHMLHGVRRPRARPWNAHVTDPHAPGQRLGLTPLRWSL